MKFAMFYELSVPRPWDSESERRVFEEAIQQVKLADEIGFNTVWVVEHHFFEEHSHASAPDIFLAACARETKNIRLGHGIAICVPEVNHPVRLAERVATLDLISGGRVDFGTGRASSWVELAGFLANPDYTKKSWDEFVRVIPKMWMEDRFGYHGQTFTLPRRAVLPKPYQKPHPPIWAAAGSRGTELDAAERGLGALFLSFYGYGTQAERIKRYRSRIAACDDPVGGFIHNRVSLTNFLYCHEDQVIGVQRGKRVASRYLEVYGAAYSVNEVYPTPAYSQLAPQWALQGQQQPQGEGVQNTPDPRWQLQRSLESEEPKAPEGLCAGDPHNVIEALKGWEETGVDEVGFMLNAGNMLTHEQVMDSLRLFGREVMPKFAGKPATAPQPAGVR